MNLFNGSLVLTTSLCFSFVIFFHTLSFGCVRSLSRRARRAVVITTFVIMISGRIVVCVIIYYINIIDKNQ